MDKDTRSAIERATQRLRMILEEDFAEQLYGDFDVDLSGGWAEKAGRHLSAQRALQRGKIVATLEHKRAAGLSPADCVADYLRDAAFTTLNRFVALKMLEARELVQECVTRGEQSSGYREFCGLAPGVSLLPDSIGYRLYIESLFDELSTEVKVLFDRRDPASVLWPKRAAFEQLLELFNAPELASVWREDETIGWVYQYFNGSDERRRMREESQAPRNSRELAVRNQFFTPRYVVQFLTDNTLGRIWYEMRSTQTTLAQHCEYLVHRPGEAFSPREKKDPRHLKVLDPACGSGHFLLYAFELLVVIYDEAHADPESPKSEATGSTLRDDYPTREALHRALPALILAHNLHGVDIDARCAQIAQLALWMRAQRAYRDFGIKREDRPPIRRSNIVVAEPLVSDDRLTKEFVARLADAELGRVFTRLVTELKLAGDLGLLLRIEQLITGVWQRNESGQLFQPAEARIRETIERFIAEEGSRANTRRRLFADDAAQGLGLLETAEKKFDVVLMNPPFGAGSMRAKKDFDKAYPRTKNDIYAAFVERGIELLSARGRLGAITSRTGFFLPRFQAWREEILLKVARPSIVADLGLGVMDAAMVEAAAYCLEKNQVGKTVFLRVLEELRDKQAALRQAIAAGDAVLGKQRFEVDPDGFSSVPGSPFAYWVSDSLRQLFSILSPFEAEGRVARRGVNTNDDQRFLRVAWECQGPEWVPHVKGGVWSPFYADPHMLLKWGLNGNELLAERVTTRVYKFAIVPSRDLYFRPGLTWPRRTKSELSPRVMPAGCIFGDKGPAAIFDGDHPDDLLALLAIANSKAFRSLVEFQLAAADAKPGGAAHSYEVGVLQRTPVPRLSNAVREHLSRLAFRAWTLRRLLDSRRELSRAFTVPALLQVPGDSVRARVEAWIDRSNSIESELRDIQERIDELCFDIYGISTADQRAIVEGFGTVAACHESAGSDLDEEIDSTEDEDDSRPPETEQGLVAEALSWAVGVAFGRFDQRLATGDRPLPPDPRPFDPLPMRSPGMWPEGQAPQDAPDILVDDEGHAADLTRLVRHIAERVHWQPPENLRAWLVREFFPLHIKTYSKSRRKAPIYWQLATPSSSYSVWLYLHALTKDTLFRVQHEYAGPKLLHEQQRLELLRREFGENPARAERKRVAEQESLVSELRTFLEEVERVASLWKPDLDDGVVINFAPLWRLVPHCASWQRELKSTWDALCEGKYDWAHLAMHLWPERVVPKCAQDRSLAIAHGLEEVFWAENSEGKWVARETPTQSIAELVRERTSPAVKAALERLRQAPAAQNGGRSRARRARATGDV